MAVTARWLLIGVLLGASSWSATGPTAADGAETHGLGLQVTVNTRPGTGALRPGIRTGAPVVTSYRLVNHGGADLHDLRVRDSAMPGARIRCPGGRNRVPLLTGLRTVRCWATGAGAARAGTWIGEAHAAGRQPYLRTTVQASAPSGYAGVGAALALRETARATGPERARIRYTVTNTGNRPAYTIRVTDPVLGKAPITCTAGSPVLSRLAPRETATCTAELRRAPGTYPSRSRAEGGDRLRTLDTRGGSVAPPRLIAYASARITLTAAPPTGSKRPGTTAPRPPAPPARGVAPPPVPVPQEPAAAAPGPAAPGPLPPGVGPLLPLPPAPPGIAAPGTAPGIAPRLTSPALPQRGRASQPGVGAEPCQRPSRL
ncbi:hypothetical protein [Streptomyces sp. KL116D]|uniref:hypothetical protein n=1 Tax=Streptomyces sp. KL116D TaxID=3045152 RepID=UPI003556885B